MSKRLYVPILIVIGLLVLGASGWADHGTAVEGVVDFPPPLSSYNDAHVDSLWDVLKGRVAQQPFNLWASLLFLFAIIHTFASHRFRTIAHDLEERHHVRIGNIDLAADPGPHRQMSSMARLFHFLGEIEAVFGIWVIPLVILMTLLLSADTTHSYFHNHVNFTEPIFVVVIMTIASTRPVLQLAEGLLRQAARLGKQTPTAWWVVLLSLGPLLGSFITEPAAMTICASLLGKRFYALKPSKRLAYGTLGLLFVSISTGGTLTHFAAPPVLMVVDAWKWDLMFMLSHFGWKAAIGIAISTAAYWLFFKKELNRLSATHKEVESEGQVQLPIPVWVTVGHLVFLVITVVHAHYPVYLILQMLFFLAFVEVTEDFQKDDFSIRPPVLVGFFLAGLVIHGGLQQWWIAPVLGSLDELSLMIGATTLTAFNDNAAITYLCTLVPTFTEGMKYAAVAGAVTGGGLTVIANAPNPAGQSILNSYFEDGISALGLLAGAIVPTIILGVVYMTL